MRNWYQPSQPIYTYNPHLREYPQDAELSCNLSPLTNFFLNVFLNAIEKRNVTIAIPDVVLRPIPIVSYLYAKQKNRSVLVFTIARDLHYKNYHLLYQHGGYFSFFVPMGFISEEGIEAKVYLPRASREYRRGYIQHLRENFLESPEPKILLSQEERMVDDIIKKLVIDEEIFDNVEVGIDTGLIIFENIDRLVHSQYTTEPFLKWLYPLLDRGVHFIFHFANPHSKFIQTIKEATNSLVVPFGTAMLRSNAEIQKKSIAYFRKIYADDKRKAKLITKYNVDRQYFYENITTVEIAEFKVGNIDYHLHKARGVLSRIDENKINNKKLYHTVKSLLCLLPNLVINPSKYKKLYEDDFVGWRYYTIPQLLELLRERIHEENEGNIVLLKDLISETYCIYAELKECKRYGEEKTYSRIAKDYQIVKTIGNAQNGGNTIVIATQWRNRKSQ
jgi:AraC-like DNA-binding protein